MYRLTVILHQLMLKLHDRGWSARRIARELAIHGEKVGGGTRTINTGQSDHLLRGCRSGITGLIALAIVPLGPVVRQKYT
jgi:hypothetical protein